jgi:hypothetical protein
MRLFDLNAYDLISYDDKKVILAKKQYNKHFKPELVVVPCARIRTKEGKIIYAGNTTADISTYDFVERIGLCDTSA